MLMSPPVSQTTHSARATRVTIKIYSDHCVDLSSDNWNAVSPLSALAALVDSLLSSPLWEVTVLTLALWDCDRIIWII